jgi:hypothetical protein
MITFESLSDIQVSLSKNDSALIGQDAQMLGTQRMSRNGGSVFYDYGDGVALSVLRLRRNDVCMSRSVEFRNGYTDINSPLLQTEGLRQFDFPGAGLCTNLNPFGA